MTEKRVLLSIACPSVFLLGKFFYGATFSVYITASIALLLAYYTIRYDLA